MDKYQYSRQFPKRDPPNLSFTRYNLCFSYSRSKEQQKHSPPPSNSTKYYSDLAMRNTSLAGFFPTKTSSSIYAQSHASTFYSQRNKKQSQYLLPPGGDFQYIKTGFPQRKKKSGEQQLLKLLLKFTDNLQPPQSQIMQPSKTALYENPQNSKGIIPKLKARTRFNWIKDRYCINRNKQEGYVIPETQRPAHPHSFSRNVGAMRRNLSLLRVQ